MALTRQQQNDVNWCLDSEIVGIIVTRVVFPNFVCVAGSVIQFLVVSFLYEMQSLSCISHLAFLVSENYFIFYQFATKEQIDFVFFLSKVLLQLQAIFQYRELKSIFLFYVV